MVPTQPRPCSPSRACWLRAWDRAKAEKLIPFRETPTTWTVKTYTVTITGAGWSDLSCTCAAGRNGRICKHAAVTAKAIAVGVLPIRGTEKGKEVAPAAAFTPAQLAVIAGGVAPSLAGFYA
ncbi:MAG TPA: hypothetical protein VNL71_13940 [Chloroflexota bacterium]|nr:hypothetical protein [Chloroflexota bacterium]